MKKHPHKYVSNHYKQALSLLVFLFQLAPLVSFQLHVALQVLLCEAIKKNKNQIEIIMVIKKISLDNVFNRLFSVGPHLF